MSTEWCPQEGSLQQVLHLFHSARLADNETHKSIFRELSALEAHPEWMQYLSFVLAEMTQETEELRQRVGIYLKSNIKKYWGSAAPVVREYVKTAVVKTMADPSQYIRATVSSIIVTICKTEGLRNWPGVLENLALLLDNPNPDIVDGAFNSLNKICEDLTHDLDSEELGRPLNVLIPKFIQFFLHSNEQFRKYAVNAVNQFLYVMPQALAINMNSYLQALFQLTRDPSREIRKRVCQAFVILLDIRLDYMQAHMSNVIKFMIMATEDEHETVALEACEFWVTYCEKDGCDMQMLGQHLEHLVPVLVGAMRYSDIDVVVLDGDVDENAQIDDEQQAIRPQFHSSRALGGANDDPTDDDGGDDDAWPEDDVTGFTLRKCAAASLDTLANIYEQDLLRIFLPHLEQVLSNPDWRTRESGILALGAVANGCYAGLEQWLPQLVDYLLPCMEDTKPLVRSITCWTLSRYVEWIMKDPSDERFFKPVMIALLKRVLDKHKKVQEAACAAFASLEEAAGERLVPYLDPILKNLMFAFKSYKARNMKVLLEAIGTTAEAVGENINRPELIQTLVPPLFDRWNALLDDDPQLFSLFECLTAVAQAMGVGFAPYAPTVFERSLASIENYFSLKARYDLMSSRGADVDEPNVEFVVCALDLLSGMSEGLGEMFGQLVANGNCLELLFQCLKNPDDDVRQSGFALLGDLAKTSIGQLRPHLGDFLPLAAEHMDPSCIGVANNAIWSIGEIAMKIGADIQPAVADLMHYLVQIMNTPSLKRSLLENTAITIGRLGLVCPEVLSPYLESFAPQWCMCLSLVRVGSEKEDCFRGLCLLVEHKPQGILDSFPQLCVAMASWQDKMTPALLELFTNMMQYLQQNIGPNWPMYWSRVDPEIQSILVQQFGL